MAMGQNLSCIRELPSISLSCPKRHLHQNTNPTVGSNGSFVNDLDNGEVSLVSLSLW